MASLQSALQRKHALEPWLAHFRCVRADYGEPWLPHSPASQDAAAKLEQAAKSHKRSAKSEREPLHLPIFLL